MSDEVIPYREVTFYSKGIVVHLSVCAPEAMTGEEVAERANKMQPTGVGPWEVAEEAFRTGEPNPAPCNTEPGHKHWLLTC